MAVIWADISALDLIPRSHTLGEEGGYQSTCTALVCMHLSFSLSLPPPSFSVFLFCYSLDSRFYLFTPFAFTAFSFLYSNSVSHTLFFFSLSLLPPSLSFSPRFTVPFHFHHALSQPCTAPSVDHPRPHFLHLVTDARCTAGACIIVRGFECAFVYTQMHTWGV